MRAGKSVLCVCLLAAMAALCSAQELKTEGNGEAQSVQSGAGEAVPAPRPALLGFRGDLRVVRPGQVVPPASARQSFLLATQSTLSARSLLLSGMTSLMAEGYGTHDDLGKGIPGYARYAWHGVLDKANGNFWTLYALPTLAHQDQRYYILGYGGARERTTYALTRVLVTRDYEGRAAANVSLLLGRAIAQGVSASYYSDQDHTVDAMAIRYGFALLRDAACNSAREFSPEIGRLLRKLRR